MSYRDDLAAAHARIEALEAELAAARAEGARLEKLVDELRVDAEAGRQAKLEHERRLSKDEAKAKRDADKAEERRMREKMEREQAEVEEALQRRERIDE